MSRGIDVYLAKLSRLECQQAMTGKDERIGFRIPSEVKRALVQIARREGRSLAQICELLLRAGLTEYEKEGSTFLQRQLRMKDKSK
jgi:hypothetical protein